MIYVFKATFMSVKELEEVGREFGKTMGYRY